MEKILLKPDDESPVTIYTLEELESLIPSPELCEHFYESNDLYISMIVAMWRFTNKKQDAGEIIRECQMNPRFMYDNTWTKEQRSEFEHRFHKILVKCLDISPYEAWHNLQEWSAFGSAFNLDDMSRENFEAYLALVKDLDELEEDED